MIEIVKKYNEIGLACLPTAKDKCPSLPKGYSWSNGVFEYSRYDNCYGIGMLCGSVSGGLECLDFDNHFNDANKNLTAFIEEIKSLYDKYKFPVEKTINGGYHLFYKCSKIEGNLKLAQRPKLDDKTNKWKPDTIIETRGEGGYFCVDPTPGYKIIKNDIFSIPIIEPEERDYIISICRSFNEWVEVRQNEYENDNEKPGNVFNKDSLAKDEVIGVLQSLGWKEIKPGQWTRPGKNKGISATFGKAAENCFYVFSSNAYPFEPLHGYSPFQVVGLLKYNGDFKEFAKELSQRYGLEKNKTQVKKEEPVKTKDELREIIKKCYIDLDVEPERPPVALFISDTQGTTTIRKRLLTLGNFSCIIGKSKSRKTFLTTMLTAAMLSDNGIYNKFYGNLQMPNRQILYFDTEQGDYDAAMTIKRIKRMSNQKNDFLGAFGLRPFSYKERCEIIEYAFTMFKNIGLVVIDGIADLARAINEEEEATRIMEFLLRNSKNHNCHIITILHQNKNDNFATGWLGSSVMKKAEVIMSVTKEKGSDKNSLVSCDFSRALDFEDFEFNISDGLPVLAEEYKESDQVDYWND